ncbi:hypothetical protein JRQ81_016891 [Phrynocephalus forsythii]|uniref:CUE domain-containing protein n=1 Tax=Phrynocephalus forsythii TaxID=171643 RepID=A0A9Q0XU42_9SAUR|nr:hypothetical protein JRQ81_016891 [Phrynocephalus forsythii]
MSLFNLDRFRFEKKVKLEKSPPSLSSSQDEATATTSSSLDAVEKDTSLSPSSEDNVTTVGREDENATDHSSRPATPASDVSEKTDDSSVPETPEAKRTTRFSFFKYRRDVIELSSESEEEEPPKYSHVKQRTAPRKDVIIINGPLRHSNATKEEEEEEEEDLNYCKLQTLKELFPQKSDEELLQLIESSATMDEAIAAGLKQVEEENGSRKRKIGESSGDGPEDNDDQSAKKKKLDPLQSPENQWEKRENLVSKLHKEFPSLDKEKRIRIV